MPNGDSVGLEIIRVSFRYRREIRAKGPDVTNSMLRLATAVSVLLAIASCGGSGSGSLGGGSPPPPPPPPTAWQPGVFQDKSTFAARCDAPRSGTNPATNQPYPDIAGTTTDENNFLRSYSDETYLWYDEITDRDPGLYVDVLAYFDLLRTTATTSSGAPKDRFHFTYDSDEWFQLSQGGVSAGYGVQWAVISGTPPRQILVAYTEPNTPAVAPGVDLIRGEEVITADGVDVANGADFNALNAAFFPANINETHTFVVRDPVSLQTRSISMTSTSITSVPVQKTKVISTPTGYVGYMVFNDHIATAEQALIDAVDFLADPANSGGQGIDDLVVDIRYNGGGFLAIASQLAYMIAGNGPTAGRTFDSVQFSDKHPVTNPVTGQAITPTPFYSTTLGPPFNGGAPGQALPALNMPRVFLLTGPGTCSASEAIMNGLRGVGVQVIQIGSTTCGKPYGFYPQDNCGTTYFTIQFRGVNELDYGDYTDGFTPAAIDDGEAMVLGCSVPDDYTQQLGNPLENRLEVALAYQAGQGCTTPSGISPGQFGKATLDATDGIVPKSLFHTNRIMLP